MSRKIFEEIIKKKIAGGMKSWPSKRLSGNDCKLLAKRVAKGIRIEPPEGPSRDPVYDATARARSTDAKDNG